MQGCGIAGATFTLLGVVFGGIGFAMRKGAQRAAWLRMNGLSATGVIQDVSPTGLSINDVPQVQFTLLVQLAGRPPYQAYAKALMSGGIPGAGGSVPLRVNPANPSEVLIEMD